MLADLPENIVENISIAVALEGDSPTGAEWKVYLINEFQQTITNVIISSKGYGLKDGKEVKTSVLRHFIGDVDSNDYAAVELLDPDLFGLNNEYWLSFYIDETIYDKKYIFLPDSIVDENLIRIPVIGKPGILIGGRKRHEQEK